MTTSKASFMLVIFASILLSFIPSNEAKSPAEIYWETNVGYIPMPKPLKDSLQLGSNDESVTLNTNYYKPSLMNEDVHLIHPHQKSADQWFISWGSIVKKSEIPQDGRVLYFTYDTLSRLGSKLKLNFQKNDNEAKFLPLNIVKSMPTTSNKLQVILNLLSVNPKSILAQDIELTMKKCEEKGVKDEKIYCAMSVQGMVDYVTSISNSGKAKMMARSTEQDDGVVMEYTIRKVQKLGRDDNRNVVCHKLTNPYAVFLCHHIKSTVLYGVTLVDANGKQMEAVAVCHKDTSSFNPRNYAFEFLNSKPSGKPICHFVSGDAVVWFQN